MESLSIISAYLLDLIFGDPRWLPHPVKGIGRLITFLEKRLRIGRGKIILRAEGLTLSVIVIAAVTLSAYLVLSFSKRVNRALEIAAWIFLGYLCLAIKDLYSHAKDILREIEGKNVEGARRRLSLIVGRDTGSLSEDKIIAATIESIAESTNDGIIAPLFYLILGGPILAAAYKTINTLDSMLGYKSERYLHFGWFAARLDDIANFIPARIAALLMVFSSFILRKGLREPLRIMRRDGVRHPSPNAGFPEAAMAGALGVRLGGPSTYSGQTCLKPYIGEERNPMRPRLISEALSVTFVSSIVMVLIGAGLRWVI